MMLELDVITLGELLIDFVPNERNLSLAATDTFVRAPGGAPANVAVGLARLGLKCGFVGKVGDDVFGRYLMGVLESEGVDVTELKFEPSARTALAFVSLQTGGERDFLFYRHPSADMLLRPEDISTTYLQRARGFHFGSLTLTSDPARSATRTAVRIARETGRLISFDPNLRLPLWESEERARAEILWALGEAQVVKLSDEELAFLIGTSEPRAARRLLHDALKVLLVTCGAEGTYFVTPEHEGHVPGFRVDAVDMTGAGDAFTAGFLSQLSRNGAIFDVPEDFEHAIRFANAVGALTTLRRGAIPALPTERDVKAFINSDGRIKS